MYKGRESGGGGGVCGVWSPAGGVEGGTGMGFYFFIIIVTVGFDSIREAGVWTILLPGWSAAPKHLTLWKKKDKK